MKKIFTSLLLILILQLHAQESGINSGTPGPSTHFILRCRASIVSEQPLYVVDGVPVDSIQLTGLNVNDIQSIHILKGPKASAIFGCHAWNGVIIITTKTGCVRKLKIEDAIDFTPLAGATVTIVKENDTTVLIADEKGFVSYQWIAPVSEMIAEVSYIGYEKMKFNVNRPENQVVRMHRKQQMMDSFVIQVYASFRRAICGCCCFGTRAEIKTITEQIPGNTFSVFPNPSPSASILHIQLVKPYRGFIEIINMAGQIVQSEFVDSGKNGSINFSLKQLPPAGYIIRLKDNKVKSDTMKIIIE